MRAGLVGLAMLLLTGCGTGSVASSAPPSAPPTVAVSTPALPPTALPPTAIISPRPVAPTATPAPTLAYQLAVLQTHRPLAADDPLVRQFAAALDALQPACQEPRQALSDYTVATHDLLAKRGVEESELSILQHVGAALPANVSAQQCDQVFAAYATLRLDSAQ